MVDHDPKQGQPGDAAAEPPFEIVIDEDVVPIGQIDFRSYLRWKEIEAARRASSGEAPAAAPAPLEVGPSASAINGSVYGGFVSLFKIAGGVSLLAASVFLGTLVNSGVHVPGFAWMKWDGGAGGARPVASGEQARAATSTSTSTMAGAGRRVVLASVDDAIASAGRAPLEVERALAPVFVFGEDEVEVAALSPVPAPEPPAVDAAAMPAAPAAPVEPPLALVRIPANFTAPADDEGIVLAAAAPTPEPAPEPEVRTAEVPAAALTAPLTPAATSLGGSSGPAKVEPAATFALALSLHERGDLQAAKAAYEALLAVDSSNGKALNNLALIYMKENASDRAEMLLKEAVAVDSGFADAYVNLGNLHAARGARELAELNYRMALKVKPSYTLARMNLVRSLERSKDLVEAEIEGRRLVAAAANDADAHALLGRVLLRLGRPADARASLDEALRIDPWHTGAELDLGVAHLAAGDAMAAKACFDRVIARAPRNAAAYNDRATAWLALGRNDDAKRDLERALDLEPGYADAHFNYGLVAERFGNFVAALEQYEHVLRVDARHARALNNLGLIYSRGKKPQEAVRLFERALAAEPAMTEVHLNRGIALCELGRRGEAAGAFDRYVAALPAGHEKRKAIQETIGRLTGRQ